MSLHKNNINLLLSNEDILSPLLAAQLITTILELLLFQRNQIPFIFSTFEYLVSSWNNEDDNECFRNFEVNRQRTAATRTFNEIKNVSEIILKAFRSNKIIKSVRFLFGPTAIMPKEVYVIKIPSVVHNFLTESHGQKFEPAIKNVMKTILTSENLHSIFSSPLNITNMYMDLELDTQQEFKNENFVEKDLIDFTPSSKHIVLNIKYENCETFPSLNSCTVFEDDAEFADVTKDVLEILKTENVNWFEAKCIVRGFQYNGKHNIWKND